MLEIFYIVYQIDYLLKDVLMEKFAKNVEYISEDLWLEIFPSCEK